MWLQNGHCKLVHCCIVYIQHVLNWQHYYMALISQARTKQHRRYSTLADIQQALEKGHSHLFQIIVQELCESRGGRPGLSVLTSLLVSVDVKLY